MSGDPEQDPPARGSPGVTAFSAGPRSASTRTGGLNCGRGAPGALAGGGPAGARPGAIASAVDGMLLAGTAVAAYAALNQHPAPPAASRCPWPMGPAGHDPEARPYTTFACGPGPTRSRRPRPLRVGARPAASTPPATKKLGPAPQGQPEHAQASYDQVPAAFKRPGERATPASERPAVHDLRQRPRRAPHAKPRKLSTGTGGTRAGQAPSRCCSIRTPPALYNPCNDYPALTILRSNRPGRSMTNRGERVARAGSIRTRSPPPRPSPGPEPRPARAGPTTRGPAETGPVPPPLPSPRRNSAKATIDGGRAWRSNWSRRSAWPHSRSTPLRPGMTVTGLRHANSVCPALLSATALGPRLGRNSARSTTAVTTNPRCRTASQSYRFRPPVDQQGARRNGSPPGSATGRGEASTKSNCFRPRRASGSSGPGSRDGR